MFSDLFKTPTIVARYQTSPYAESRDQFLRKTRDDGKSPSTIKYIAWALRVVAETVDLCWRKCNDRNLVQPTRRHGLPEVSLGSTKCGV
jgi:hypothetical protein